MAFSALFQEYCHLVGKVHFDQESPANSSHTALHSQGKGDSTKSQGRNLTLDHLMVERLFVSDLQEESMCPWKDKRVGCGILRSEVGMKDDHGALPP